MTAAASLDTGTTIALFVASIVINVAILTLFATIYGRPSLDSKRQIIRLRATTDRLTLIVDTVGSALDALLTLNDFQRGLIHRLLVEAGDPRVVAAMDLALERERFVAKAVLELAVLEAGSTSKASAARRLSEELGDGQSLRVLEFERARLAGRKRKRRNTRELAQIERAISDLRSRLSE